MAFKQQYAKASVWWS